MKTFICILKYVYMPFHQPWHKACSSGSSCIPILQLDQKKEKEKIGQTRESSGGYKLWGNSRESQTWFLIGTKEAG